MSRWLWVFFCLLNNVRNLYDKMVLILSISYQHEARSNSSSHFLVHFISAIISLNRHFLNKRNACSSKWWNYYCVWATLFDIYLFSKLKSCYIFSNLCSTMEVELKWNIWILNAKRDNKSFAGQTFDFIQDVEDSVFETTNLYLEISRFVIWTGRCRSAIEVHNCCMQKLALQFFFPL